MASRYAEKTSTPVDRSKAEIERILRRYGATGFMYGWQENMAIIGFQMNQRTYQLRLPLPDENDDAVVMTPTGRRRTGSVREAALKQEERRRWRALALVIKALLEAAASGIATIDKLFLAHAMLPDGSTVGDWVDPQLDTIYRTKEMPRLLPGVSEE